MSSNWGSRFQGALDKLSSIVAVPKAADKLRSIVEAGDKLSSIVAVPGRPPASSRPRVFTVAEAGVGGDRVENARLFDVLGGCPGVRHGHGV